MKHTVVVACAGMSGLVACSPKPKPMSLQQEVILDKYGNAVMKVSPLGQVVRMLNDTEPRSLGKTSQDPDATNDVSQNGNQNQNQNQNESSSG